MIKSAVIDIAPVLKFLPCPTPEAWIDEARKPHNLPIILVDHANNELKAAQSAMTIIGRYRTGHFRAGNRDRPEAEGGNNNTECQLKMQDQLELLNKMSRLAREELRHYEQVLAIMVRRDIPYLHLGAGRYASRLSSMIRTFEPARLVDTLIMGAFIEARSCERFSALAPWLDDELAKFYRSLLKSESRHFQDYLTLAETINEGPVDDRVALFANIEREAIESGDEDFRFHSGKPESGSKKS